jgi:phosphomannomutase/phosphoglucomutase
MATALILDIMAKSGEKLSKLLGELPKYFIEKGKIECPEPLKQKVLDKLVERLKNLNINTIDGVKIWFEDKSAILIRPSGTEPIYRLYAEAKNQAKASKLVKDYSAELEKIIKELKH